jgi:hypothetical protein
VPGQVICEFDPTPEMQDHAHFVALAVNQYPNLCNQIGELTASHNEVSAKLSQMVRMQEIIADIGFYVGHRWRTLHVIPSQAILDCLHGSRGLMDEVVIWAKEFDAYWEALPEDHDDRENYIEVVESFAGRKFDELLVKVER